MKANNKHYKYHRVKKVTMCRKNNNGFFVYEKPWNSSDFKRYGKKMEIHMPGCSFTLNGRQINTLVSILKAVGEFDQEVNMSKAKIW